MDRLAEKYDRKLVSAGLADPGDPLIGMLDAEVTWNRTDKACDVLNGAFSHLDINSLLFCRPAEPYRTIIDFLARRHPDGIHPNDCETRTFLHELPVSPGFSTDAVVSALRRCKSLIVPKLGVAALGTVSPEQAFIVFSSVCFAAFVKFFSDYLTERARGPVPREFAETFERVCDLLAPIEIEGSAALAKGPFVTPEQVVQAMDQAGSRTVECRLVDSFFGNISCRLGDTIYISQTSSSLDELIGCIDPCPLDGSSCAGVTASSELTAHRETLIGTDKLAILHGHPRFSVVMSMACDRSDCEHVGECHRRCPHERQVCGIPIVPGEVGTGPYGLCNTVPKAMQGNRGVMVYGHGLFTTGKVDFTDAFESLYHIEAECREEYFARVDQLSRG